MTDIAEKAKAALEQALAEPAPPTMSIPAVKPKEPLFDLIEGKYGRFLIPPKDQFVGEALRKYGEYSEVELGVLLQLSGPGKRVVVVGANIGSLVVPLAQHSTEVVAIEAQRWVFTLLCANIALNNLTNVRPYWCAAGNKGGVLQVPVLEPSIHNNFGALELETVQDPSVGGDLVPVYQLDSMPHMECHLLTIDVEGMELEVMEGGKELITATRPVIFFEADRVLKRKDCFDWLRAHKYALFWYRTPLYNPHNFRGDKENIFIDPQGRLYVAENCIAIPQESPIKLNGFTPVLDL